MSDNSGFISIVQANRDGDRHTSTLMWHKGSDHVDVLGNIPHGNKIHITRDLIDQLQAVISS